MTAPHLYRMTEQEWRQRIGRPLACARERSARIASVLARRVGQPPSPGDIFFVVSDAVDREWIVVALDAAHTRVVPADEAPVTGDGDVRLDDASDSAPLTARCRLACWIRAGGLAGARRTGVLDAGELAQVRSKLRALDEGAPSPPEDDVDRSCAYRALCEAHRALPDVWVDAGDVRRRGARVQLARFQGRPTRGEARGTRMR